MTLRNMLRTGLLLLVAALPARAQTTLAWKFEADKKFQIEVVTETKQTITVDNKPTTRSSTFTTTYSFVVKKAEAGSYTLEQTIENVQVKTSKSDEATTPAASRYANLLKGAKFTFTINAAGKITGHLDGYDDLIKKLSGNNEKTEKELRAVIPEDGFKEELGVIFGFLPDKPVKEEETWTRKESLALLWGKLTGEAKYTYKGKKEGGSQIDVTHAWTYAPTNAASSGVSVTKGDVQVPVAKGTILFDASAGRLISHKQTTQITGKLTIVGVSAKDPTGKESKETTCTIDQTTLRTIKPVDAK